MKQLLISSVFYFSITFCNAQTVADFIKESSLDQLKSAINELSGETSAKVNGATVTIKNRVSSKGNDLAADYIKERLNSYGLTATDQEMYMRYKPVKQDPMTFTSFAGIMMP